MDYSRKFAKLGRELFGTTTVMPNHKKWLDAGYFLFHKRPCQFTEEDKCVLIVWYIVFNGDAEKFRRQVKYEAAEFGLEHRRLTQKFNEIADKVAGKAHRQGVRAGDSWAYDNTDDELSDSPPPNCC